MIIIFQKSSCHRPSINFLVFCLVSVLTSLAYPALADEHGLKIGQKAPEFRLKSADGTELALTNLLARGKVALIFYRSADW